MKKTISSVIANFNLQKLQEKYRELHEVGAPRLFIEGIKAMMEDAKNGKVAVKGMARKHQVADKEVIRVYAAQTVAYDYALPHHGDEMPTTMLMFVDEKGDVYFWDYFTNQIAKEQSELSVKAVDAGWVSWITSDEENESSGYFDVEYTPKGTMAMTKTTIFAPDEYAAKVNFMAMFGGWAEMKGVTPVTKAEATKRGLNF